MIAERVAARYKEKVQTEKGNTVYTYSDRQISRRNNEKAKRLEQLRQNVHKVRSQIKKDLASGDPEKVLTALAVGLMDHTAERVGNSESAKEGHYGVTGWTKDHIKFSGGKATVSYVGKSGVKQKKTVSDKALVRALKDAVEACEDGSIFCHESATIDAKKVNKYLERFDITAKDLRGLHANQTMQAKLKKTRKGELPTDPKERKKLLKKEFKRALEETAAEVGHEPSTLRSQYLVPGLEDEYMKGRVMDTMTKSARAIPVDKPGIQALSKELAKLVYRKTDGKTPLGKQVINPRPYPYSVVAVDGSVLDCWIVLDTEVNPGSPYYVLGGGFGKSGSKLVVVVHLNGGTVIPKNTGGVLEKQLYAVLLHELTHVADKYKGRGPAQDLSKDEAAGNAAYYNNPGEVRAYMQEVVDELEGFVQYLPKLQQAFGISKGVEYLLKRSDTWNEVSPHWTESNKRKVIKAVAQLIDAHMAEKVANKVLQFPSKGPSIKVRGKTYALSDYWPMMGLDDEEGGARGHHSYLWAYDTDRQVLAMWRHSSGDQKVYGPARSMGHHIAVLEKKRQLNRVIRSEFEALDKEMQVRYQKAEDNLRKVIEESASHWDRKVAQALKTWFKREVLPELKRRLADVERGATPLGFKHEESPHLPKERQAKMFVVDAVLGKYDLKTVEKAVEKETGTPVDSPGLDNQAVYFAWMDLRQSISEQVSRNKLASKQAGKATFDVAAIEKLRKDFLVLVKNVPYVVKEWKNDNTLPHEDFRKVLRKYREAFNTVLYDRVLNRAVKDMGPVGQTIDYYLREPGWDLYIEMSNYPENPSSFRDIEAWDKRIRRKAQKFWKNAKDIMTRIQKTVTYDVPDQLILEGFQIRIVDFKEGREQYFEGLKASLKVYRRNASARMPWLVKNQLPLVVDFEGGLDKGGMYRGKDIWVNATAGSSSIPERVRILAHEMGHHRFKHLSSPATKFWSVAITQDYGDLSVEKVLKAWPAGVSSSWSFVEAMAKKDPVLALQVDTLTFGHGGDQAYTSKSDFEEALAEGQSTLRVPNVPITGYGAKNPEEAFCEAIGLLVAYGPRAVHPKIQHWLSIILDGEIKLASASDAV